MIVLSLPGVPQPAKLVRHARASGRLRLEVPGLRGRDDLARRLERSLRADAPGVEEVRADARSGRVLIRCAPDAPLFERLEERADPRPRPRRRSRASRRSSRVVVAWHAIDLEQVFERLGTDRNGISGDEAARRLRLHGPNALADAEPRSRLTVLRSQVQNLPALLLMGSSGLSLLARELLDAGAILSAVGLDAVIGYRIERQNETLIASWRRLEAGEARVMRDGPIRKIPAADLTAGDVVVLRAGDTVPADARIVDAHRFACDEAILTGESEPREKGSAAVAAGAPLAERANMVYAGTSVVSGRARVVVTAVGPDTEAARIRELLEAEKAPETTFERRLGELGAQLSIAGAASGVAAAAAGILHRRPVSELIGNAASLAVAAIPEGLPVVSTSALLRSMQRMRERGMVVRRLVSAETLGGVTVVCADKTGTLTRNEMKLEVLDLGRGPIDADSVSAAPEKLFDDSATLALAAGVLNADVELHGRGESLSVSGSPTEKALVQGAEAAGLDCRALFGDLPRRSLRERDHGAHYVLSLHDAPDGGCVAFVKGAPEQVVRLCESDLTGPLDAEARARVHDRNAAMAEDGLRVLAVGWRRASGAPGEDLARGHTLLGLLGLRDPLREGAADTVAAATRAGIRTLIVTGDQRRTAAAIARAVGLEGEVLDGAEMSRLLEADGAEVRERLRRVAAISRVAPGDKASLVRALREAGDVVAMAGDGVNDAPALKAADVGIAIGARASDVAREAADIVLPGEDLASILYAVGEGRVVQDNLRRAVYFLLATNLSEVVLALGSATLGVQSPFTPLRLLWLNLLSDTVPALALALEPADGDVLARPPAPPEAPLVSEAARRRALRDGLWMAGLGAVTLAVAGPAASFSALTGAQLGYALACRAPGSPPDARFKQLLGGTAGMHVAAIALPPVRSAFRLPPVLSVAELAAFGVGFALPWAATHSARNGVVVRRGRNSEVNP